MSYKISDQPFDDSSHRVLPESFPTLRGIRKVAKVESFPDGITPGSPLGKGMTHVKVTLEDGGLRWFGCKRAYINSSLRMVLVGHNSKDEIRALWKKVKEQG